MTAYPGSGIMLPLATAVAGGVAEGHASELGEAHYGRRCRPDRCGCSEPICLWCEGGFDIRKGGGASQRFCQPKCRDAFHSAGRRWAEMAVLSGVITEGDLRNGSVTPCTLAGREEGTSDYPGIASDENALSAAQRASVQKVQLELSIAPDGVLDLCRLGWLDPDTTQDAGAVGDAVAELTNAALSQCLRPNRGG